MASNIEIIKSKLLLVEGVDAHRFFIFALDAFGVDDVQVIDFGGIGELTARLNTLILLPHYEQVITLVIARDAESDPKAAVNSVKKSLKQVKLSVPANSFEFTGKTPRLAFMLFPGFDADSVDNKILLPGCLEDLCLKIVKDCSTLDCVDQYMECLESTGHKISRLHKTKLHSYLAGKDEFVGMKIGEASKAGAWDWNHTRLNRFKTILISM